MGRGLDRLSGARRALLAGVLFDAAGGASKLPPAPDAGLMNAAEPEERTHRGEDRAKELEDPERGHGSSRLAGFPAGRPASMI